MNDILYFYIRYEAHCPEEEDVIEALFPRIDQILKEHGWEYTGLQNMYRPVKGTDPDETWGEAKKAIESAKFLRRYHPYVTTGILTNFCDLHEIKVPNPDPYDPCSPIFQEKLRRYEEYYDRTGKYVHGIIVDENMVLMDGYITFLLAQKKKIAPKIMCVRRDQVFSKTVTGKNVWKTAGNTYIELCEDMVTWLYPDGPAVVPGDIVKVPSTKGEKFLRVEVVSYVAGPYDCSRFHSVLGHTGEHADKPGT